MRIRFTLVLLVGLRLAMVQNKSGTNNKKYGGKYLVRSGGMAFDKDPNKKVTPGEGNWSPNRLILLGWNSMEELQIFIKSAEYQKVTELRNNYSSTKSVIVKENLTD